MVSSSQKRILTWLSQFSPDIENSWDATRDIALPGIADGLGVVRSALNLPLKKLEQYASLKRTWDEIEVRSCRWFRRLCYSCVLRMGLRLL